MVAVPEDPAIGMWTRAADATGVARPRIVPWAEVLDGSACFTAGELVHAERLTPAVPLRYGGSRARYEAFAKALGLLDALIASAGATASADSTALLLALDRQRCAEYLSVAGVPVPQVGGEVVRQRFAEPGDAIFHVGVHIRTPMTLLRSRSALELRHQSAQRAYRGAKHQSDDEIVTGEIVRDLLEREDETYRVKDLPYAYLNEALYRFRFAVLDGRVTHAVGRLADDRPAREYFGGKRRDIAAYCERFGDSAWQDLIRIAEHAAAVFPSLRLVGVDVAPDQTGGRDFVYDIDPFGPRLPGALGLEGTAGEGLELPATVLRAWAARQAG